MKYLGINLMKDMKELYIENYRILLRKIKHDLNKWRNTLLLGQKTQYC